MKPCIDMLFSNALLTIPIALAVAVIARWVKRPAAVHALWIIVLLKLFSPQVYNLPVPQIGDLPVPLAAWSSAPSHESTHVSVPQTLSTEVRPRESLSSQHNFFWQETVHGFRDSERDARNAIASQPRRAKDDNSVPSGALPSRIASRRVSTQPASASSVSTKPVLISSVSLRSICVALWLMGSVIFFAVLGYRVRLFHRFVKRAPTADASMQKLAAEIATRYRLSRIPQIRYADGDFPPLLWVLPRSATIVLPTRLLAQLSREDRRSLLAHELAHYARGDHWVRLLESTALGMFWWHPLVWWIRRQLQHAEEQCCDAWVLWAFPKTQTEYARTLLATLDFLTGATRALPPLASGLGRSNLVQRRFEMILHQKSPRKISPIGAIVLATVAFAILPFSASMVAHAQEEGVAERVVAAAATNVEINDSKTKKLEKQKRRKARRAPRKQRTKSDDTSELKKSNELQNQDQDQVQVQAQDVNAREISQFIKTTLREAIREMRRGVSDARDELDAIANDPNAGAPRAKGQTEWFDTLAERLIGPDGLSEEDVDAIADHAEKALQHFGTAVEKSADAIAQIMETELKAIEQDLANAEDDGADANELASRTFRALESSGMTQEQLGEVTATIQNAMKQLQSDLKHVMEEAPGKAAKANKRKLKQEAAKREKADKTPRGKKRNSETIETSDEEVQSLLRQIRSLVRQLEEKVEEQADAPSARR